MTTITKPLRPHFSLDDQAAGHETMPTRVNTAVTVVSGLPYTFSIADFDLIGGSGEDLSAVCVAGLERRGTLTLCGAPVQLNDVVTRDEIEAGRLQFVAGSDADGYEYDNFLFVTHDGVEWGRAPMSMLLHTIAAAAAPPAVVSAEKNDELPAALDSFVNTGEGTAYAFKPTDFNFQGVEGEFEHIQLVSLETCGLLLFDGVEVTFGQVIPVGDIDVELLTFEPQEPGKEGFEFKVHDGRAWSEEAYSMVIEVTPYYHPPTASDNVIDTVVSEPYVFDASDFNYNDFDDDELTKIQVTRLECKGAVRLDGVPIDPNQVIHRAELDESCLDFAPVVDGTSDVFWFKVHDGTAYSNDEYQMRMRVHEPRNEPVYDAPAPIHDAPVYDAAIDDELPADSIHAPAEEYVDDVTTGVDPLRELDTYLAAEFTSVSDLDFAAATPARGTDLPIVEDVPPSLDSVYPGPESGLYPAVPPTPSVPASPPASRSPRYQPQPRPRSQPRMRRHYELTVTTREDEAYVFSATDFSPDSGPIEEIQIISMEICGLLQLDGMAVTPGQRITQADLEEERVTFIPGGIGTHKYFEFKARRGPKWSMAKCSMSIEVTPAYNQGRPGPRLP